MDKLKLHTPDFTQENIARLAELFPNCVTEAKTEDGTIKRAIDFDQLRQELSDHVVDGPRERYHLNWPGKREALLAANAPITKTLRPCREESVDFDTTQNLFIEGDNLDALKLLQETYLNRVAMIFIDPPYNTGKDFLYRDRYAIDSDDYFALSEAKDHTGQKLVLNTEASGRFHSAWLTMIYPRIRLARNLLRDNGVLFVTIDDGEVANLRRVCDEIFGETNFLGNIVWQKTYSPANDKKGIDAMHDHILVYQRNAESGVNLLPRTSKQDDAYKNPDDDPRGPWKAVDATRAEHRDYAYFPIETPSGDTVYPADGRSWVFTKEELPKLLADNRLWFGASGTSKPSKKLFLTEVKQGVTPTTWWDHEDAGHNDQAKKEIKTLFPDSSPFPTPKPTKLVRRAAQIATNSQTSDIVIDFFSGSATTAHAILSLNAEDGGNRQFVMVQLPEACDPSSSAFKAGFHTIADIAKERIRRAGKKAKDDAGLLGEKLDIGFRVLKVDTSNMKDVYYKPDAVKKDDLFDHIENIKEDRTPEDLLFQVLLDWGVELSLPIAHETIDGKTVFFVDENALAACFEPGITEELVKKLAARKPLRAVFRDSGYGSDAVKINVEQIFKLISPGTEVKAI